MIAIWISVLILSNFYQIFCQTPSCKTNCITDEQCWRDTLSYHSSELVEQLFSFSSLSVHVRNFQESSSDTVTDSVAFITEALAEHLTTETKNANLSLNLFQVANQTLIELCKNLTVTKIDTVDELPSLICSPETCASKSMNSLTLLVISILIASIVLLLCIGQSYGVYRKEKHLRTRTRPVSFAPTYSANDGNLNINPFRF